jgi:ABC-2 type transport system permease protein
MHGLRVYLALIGASIRAQLRYKLSLVFNILGYFVIMWAEFVAVWILFDHFGVLAGWRFEEVLICYGLAHLSYAISEYLVRGFEFLAFLSRAGDYDRLLLRPVSTLVQLAGHEFALHRLGRTLQTVIILVIGVALLDEPVSVGGIVLLLWALIGGGALFCGLFILQGSVGMKVLQNIEVFNILTNGGAEMSQFPMSIYPRPMRLLVTFLVPYAAVVYYPAATFLSRTDVGPPVVGWLGPLGGLAFLALSLLVFRLVESSYVSTGS